MLTEDYTRNPSGPILITRLESVVRDKRPLDSMSEINIHAQKDCGTVNTS